MKPLISALPHLRTLGRTQNPRGLVVTHPWEAGLAKDCSELWYVFHGEGKLRADGGAWQPLRAGMLVWFHRARFYEWRQDPEHPLGVNFFHFDLRAAAGGRLDEAEIPETVEAMDPVFAESLSRRIIEMYWEVYYEEVVRCGTPADASHVPHPRFLKEPEPVRRAAFLPEPMGIEAPERLEHPLLQHAANLFNCLIDEYRHLATRKRSLEEVGLQLFHRRTIHDLVARLQEDLSSVPTVSEMAARCGYSLDHFGRVFRKVMGCGAQEFVMKARVARARQLLLESGLSVKQIAAELGYNSPFFFSRQFRSIVGESPTDFRRRHAGDVTGGAPPTASAPQ
ncbi:MAG: helix-turn-helix transcriptional regulator [Opitutales bacterium]|nr:helix-turn-helix transcriptional regulator [Opitutales bacterium]